MEGAWKQGERAGTGKGAALPSSWKTKQALNPFLVEPALLDAQGAVVSGVPFPSCRSSRAKTCPFVPDFCRASLEVQQSPSSRLCRQGPRSTGIFPGWQPAPTHQLSQFRSRELFPSSPTSASACPRAPILLIPPLLWAQSSCGVGEAGASQFGGRMGLSLCHWALW